MKSRLLETKFHIPPWREAGVSRPRLVGQINAGRKAGHKLTLISAPPGYGKSTLAAEWIHSLGDQPRVAWLSLDAGDNDLARFIGYWVAAFQRVDDSVGQNTQGILGLPQLPPMQVVLDELLNELALAQAPVALVLDDYHVIHHPGLFEAVEYFIEHLPSQIHLVITTREDPALSLPRLRARGQLTEIRERDLRFSPAEAEAFFNQTMGLKLVNQAVTVLEAHTEGWVAGLQLAAIALQEYSNAADVQAFVDSFAGTDRYIVDYLVSEVLLRQSDAARHFLIVTSILERMCGDLCEAVLGENNHPWRSRDFLAQLEHANMFIIPLDNQRQWYRYHHLFSEMLLHTLHQTPQIDIPALHQRASAWYEQHGFLPEAVAHAFKAGDWDFAAQLVERHAMDVLSQGQAAQLQEWLGCFPEPILQARPGLCIFQAWAWTLTLRPEFRLRVKEKLLQAEQALDAREYPPLAPLGPGGAFVPFQEWVAGHGYAIRGQLLLAAFNEPIDAQEVIDLSLRGLELLPDVEKLVRSICYIALAHAHLILGEVNEAEKAFAQCLNMALVGENYLSAVTAIFYQSNLAYEQGRLKRAFEICTQGLAQLAPKFKNPDQDFPAIRSLYVMQAVILLEWDQLEAAQRLLELSTNLVGWALWAELTAYIALVRLWEIQGNSAEALRVLHRMQKMAPQIANCAEALLIRHMLTRQPEDAEARKIAEHLLQTRQPDLEASLAPPGIGQYSVNLIWLQILVAVGHADEALAQLPRLLTPARERGLTQRLLELSIVQVEALSEKGETERAAELLAEALSIAEPEGYLNLFDQGPRLNRLLVELARQGKYQAYIQRLLAAHSAHISREKPEPEPARAGKAGKTGGLVELLSAREVEVLRLLSTGLTLQKIAGQLYLSHNTLKAHTQNIYTKLEAHNRLEAVNKARESGLI